MNIPTLDKAPIDISGDVFPQYDNEQLSTQDIPKDDEPYNVSAKNVAGINAVTAAGAGPNLLVATDAEGKLPISIIPVLAGTSAVIGATGTYAALKAAPLAGLYFAWATDIGQGALVFNSGAAGIGDSGWVIIAGG